MVVHGVAVLHLVVCLPGPGLRESVIVEQTPEVKLCLNVAFLIVQTSESLTADKGESQLLLMVVKLVIVSHVGCLYF